MKGERNTFIQTILIEVDDVVITLVLEK